MKLIYAWIEDFRNIKQCGFAISNEYSIEVVDNGFVNVSDNRLRIKSFKISKSAEYISIFNNCKNVDDITIIVGQNGTGKSNLLTCIGDLLNSFEESKFILIYSDDENADHYYIECNQIAVKDDLNNVFHALQSNYQPQTTMLELRNGVIKKYKDNNYINKSLEFISIKNHFGKYENYPNANALYSNIGRFGLDYNRAGLFYKFDFLRNSNESNLNISNRFLNISFELAYLSSDKKVIQILPENYPGKECIFDFYQVGGSEIYKRTFMLRFFEVILSSFRSYLDFKEKIRKKVSILEKIISDCNYNIDALTDSYEDIKNAVVGIKKVLMKEHCPNTVDINKYVELFELLESVIDRVDKSCFHSSYRFAISFETILSDEGLTSVIKELFNIIDESEIGLDLIPNCLEIKINNLSDGAEYLINLYSTIHKCLCQNNATSYERIVLVLDEPEAHMHPEWCRRLIYDIINFINNEKYFDTNMKFQIIISTHSPFILSDVSSNNVIYLDKNDDGYCIIKKNDIATFGANIHTLFKDNFFMDSTIGEFARNKINLIIEFVKPKIDSKNANKISYNKITKEKYDLLRIQISNIGESILKEKLLQMLDECYYSSNRGEIIKKLKFERHKINEKLRLFEGMDSDK